MKTILRQRRSINFTIIDNASAQDPELSWKATGLWVYMLTMPDDWQFNLTDLANRKTDGMGSTKSGLDELEQAGYIRRGVERRENGTIAAHVIEVRDSLTTSWPDCSFPHVDDPDVVQPDVDNRLQQSTHSTKDTETEDTETEPSDRDRVWQAYLDGLGSFRKGTRLPKFSHARKQLIDRRLQNYSADDLVLAVTGWLKSPFHRGENDGGKVYNTIELLLRNDEKIDQFISYHDARPPQDKQAVNQAHRPEQAPRTISVIQLGGEQEDFLDDR